MNTSIHIYLDWDNVGVRGMMHCMERIDTFQSRDENINIHITIIGIHQSSVSMPTEVWTTFMNFAKHHDIDWYFHKETKKNASDFMICLTIGQQLAKWMNDNRRHLIWIVSGDTSFEVLPTYIVETCLHTPLDNRVFVEIMNIHRPFQETSKKDTITDEQEEQCDIVVEYEDDDDERTSTEITDDGEDDPFLTQQTFVELSQDESKPLLHYDDYGKFSFDGNPNPNPKDFRYFQSMENVSKTTDYVSSSSLPELLDEWKKNNICFPVSQKKLLRKLKDYYGDTRGGRERLREVLGGNTNKKNQSIATNLQSFLRRNHFHIEGKHKVVTMTDLTGVVKPNDGR